tara:strand:+ start:180 stop:482 length:303 start_codon:yes stop_codon:yes gene_type:complete
MSYENVYGTSPYETGDDAADEEYIVGDLVTFAGRLFTPDYVYVDMYDTEKPLLGIVISIKMYGSILPRSKMYKVHWLNKSRPSEVVGGHLRRAHKRARRE